MIAEPIDEAFAELERREENLRRFRALRRSLEAMTPAEEIRAARQKLGLSASGLAKALGLGANGARTIRRYEAGEILPSGPVLVALRLLVEKAEATKRET